jgi:hypothetical protein
MLGKKGPMTPYAVASELGWGRRRYPSAKQACLRLAAKGLAFFHAERFGLKMMKQMYAPTALGLLELIYTMPDKQLNDVLTRPHNKEILPLLKKLDDQMTLISCLREVWRDLRANVSSNFSRVNRVYVSPKLNDSKKIPRRYEDDQTLLMFQEWPWRMFSGLTREFEDVFYRELFTRPFQTSASQGPKMRTFRKMIVDDAQLTLIARRVFGERKCELQREIVGIELLEAQLNPDKEQSDLSRIRKKLLLELGKPKSGASAGEIVAEVLKAPNEPDS